MTGLDDAAMEAFAKQMTEASRAIDVREVWELLVEDARPITQGVTLQEIAGLLFGDEAGAEQLAGLATHLETMPVYFQRRGHAYTARSGDEIAQAAERKRKEAERQAAEASVIGGPDAGTAVRHGATARVGSSRVCRARRRAPPC
jgi:hypothetical protein